MDFKKLNKDIKKNTINNSFLKKYIINTNKVKENNPKLENTFNTKIRKVSSIDYLYNNKTKKKRNRKVKIKTNNIRRIFKNNINKTPRRKKRNTNKKKNRKLPIRKYRKHKRRTNKKFINRTI